MTTESISLELSPREVLGKKVKRLRRQGVIPVHLYGPGVEPQPLQCETTRLVDVLVRAGGNTAVTVSVQGTKETHLASHSHLSCRIVKGQAQGMRRH